MPGCGKPILYDTFELLRSHACVGCHHKFNETSQASGSKGLHVSGEGLRKMKDYQVVEKVDFLRLLKNAQMQGSRNPEK